MDWGRMHHLYWSNVWDCNFAVRESLSKPATAPSNQILQIDWCYYLSGEKTTITHDTTKNIFATPLPPPRRAPQHTTRQPAAAKNKSEVLVVLATTRDLTMGGQWADTKVARAIWILFLTYYVYILCSIVCSTSTTKCHPIKDSYPASMGRWDVWNNYRRRKPEKKTSRSLRRINRITTTIHARNSQRCFFSPEKKRWKKYFRIFNRIHTENTLLGACWMLGVNCVVLCPATIVLCLMWYTSRSRSTTIFLPVLLSSLLEAIYTLHIQGTAPQLLRNVTLRTRENKTQNDVRIRYFRVFCRGQVLWWKRDHGRSSNNQREEIRCVVVVCPSQ